MRDNTPLSVTREVVEIVHKVIVEILAQLNIPCGAHVQPGTFEYAFEINVEHVRLIVMVEMLYIFEERLIQRYNVVGPGRGAAAAAQDKANRAMMELLAEWGEEGSESSGSKKTKKKKKKSKRKTKGISCVNNESAIGTQVAKGEEVLNVDHEKGENDLHAGGAADVADAKGSVKKKKKKKKKKRKKKGNCEASTGERCERGRQDPECVLEAAANGHQIDEKADLLMAREWAEERRKNRAVDGESMESKGKTVLSALCSTLSDRLTKKIADTKSWKLRPKVKSAQDASAAREAMSDFEAMLAAAKQDGVRA